jgi:hypothetical protein
MSYYNDPYGGAYVMVPTLGRSQPGTPGAPAAAPAAAAGALPPAYGVGAPVYNVPAGYVATGGPEAMAGAALAARAAPAQPIFSFGTERFVRGLLIGAAAAYLLTNEEVQRTVIKGAVKAWFAVQGGLEEAKERFRDAEAEIQAAAAEKHP